MSTELLSELNSLLEEARSRGVFTRASLGVVTPREQRFVNIGELESGMVSEETLFDVASVTKTVPVSTLALIALDKGLVDLNTPVETISEEIRLESATPVLYKHLLTQTLDFQFSMSSFKELSPEEIWNTIRFAKLKAVPGTSFFYCNATSVLLGKVVEELFGAGLDELAESYIFRPLGMKHSQFRPERSLNARIVPTEIDSWRGRAIQGEIHDESSWVLNQLFIPGAAGLFSSTLDLTKYVSTVLSDDGLICRKGFWKNCAKNWIENVEGSQTGLGFEYSQPYMGESRSDATVGKTGFTGSVVVIDFQRFAGFVLLTDYTWPHRKPDRSAINEVRAAVADLIWKYSDLL